MSRRLRHRSTSADIKVHYPGRGSSVRALR
jgi:hypothetical protein